MHRSTRYLFVAALLGSTACKNVSTSNENSSLSAEAQAIADGNEIALTAGSVPSPKFSQKTSPDDLDPRKVALGEQFERNRVGEFQIAGSDLTGTPRELQGIWWMDGTPLADETVSFANVDFTLEKPILNVFGPNNFTYHGGEIGDEYPKGDSLYKKGSQLHSITKALTLVYELEWVGTGGSKYEKARIVPAVRAKLGVLEKWLRISPKIIEFTMTRQSEHVYSRDSSFFGKTTEGYSFRRILIPSDKDPKVLEQTEWWPMFAKQSAPTYIRLAAKK